MNDRKIKSILKEVKQYFGFLYEKGYRVQRADYHSEDFGNWDVEFEFKDSVLEISNDRNEIMVYLLPLDRNSKYRFSIKEMVYFLSRGQKFIDSFKGSLAWGKKKQYLELAELLRNYLDQITPYFGNNFHDHREDLLSAQRAYFEQVVNRRSLEHKY